MTDDSTSTHKATVTICNRMGLHARPAVVFVELANKYNAAVVIRSAEQAVDGKSIMQIMMLAAIQGTELEIETVGPDAGQLLGELTDLVNRNFDED
jgi:phosphocarrier protein HPr